MMKHLPQFAIILACFASMASASPVPPEEETGKTDPEDVLPFDEILKTNKETSGSMFEGDIIMPRTRNAIQDETFKWTHTVPYVLEDRYGYFERDLIHRILSEFSVRSCLNFVRWTNETNYLSYEWKDGCYSGVGMGGGQQRISLGGGCLGRGIIIHETLHAMGFWHEQSRTDRDDWVKIVWEVISDSDEHNFNKYNNNTIDLMGEQYDYASIMHYSPTAFSMNGSQTIVGLRDGKENMGQRSGFSITDLRKLNNLYECSGMVGTDGYTAWTEWSACDMDCERKRTRFCDGEQCTEWGKEEVETATCDVECTVGFDPDCGQIEYIDSTGAIASPLFPYSYKNSALCTKVMKGPVGSRVHLHFQLMDVEDWKGGCYYDYVHVYDGGDSSAPKVGTYCYTDIPAPIISSGNALTVVFDSDGSVTKKGYMAQYYISSAPIHTCSFEYIDHYCGWIQNTTDEEDFIHRTGNTPSAETGPSVDHTLGTSKGGYLFLESSQPSVNGNRARLLSPVFKPAGRTICFSLWYNMYGINIGTLNVYHVSNGVLEATPMITVSGDKGNDDWYRIGSTIAAASDDFQVVVEAVRYNGFKGDIAIDDVMLEEGPCPVF